MRRVTAVMCACTATLALAGPVRAAGTWLPETAASGAADQVDSVDVSIGADGHAAVVWGRKADYGWNRTIHLRRRTPAGVWGPVENVSTPYSDPYAPGQAPYSAHDRPTVAVDGTGNTLVTWVTGGGTGPGAQGNLYLEAYAPVGQPVGAQHVFASDANGSTGAAQTDVQFGPSGEALITWLEVDEQFHSVVRAPDGTLGAETVVPKSDPDSDVLYQDLSYGRDGSAVLAWSEEVRNADRFADRAFVAVRRPGGTWSSPQLLLEDRDRQHTAYQVQVGVSRDGSAIVAANNYKSDRPLPVQLAALPAGSSTFGPTRLAPEVDAALAVDDVVADAPGRASIIGLTGPYGKKKPVVADVTADGSPASITQLGDTGMEERPVSPRTTAAFDSSGGLHVAWMAAPDDALGGSGPWHVYRTYRPAGGSFAAVDGTPNGSGFIADLSLAAGSQGDAISAWSAGDSYLDRQLFLSALGSTPKPVATPKSTPTPAPTPTASPTPSPTKTPTPSGPVTRTPTPTPTAAATPAPASTPVVTPTPAATVATAATTAAVHDSSVPDVAPQPPALVIPEIVTELVPALRALDATTSPRFAATAPTSVCTIPDVRGNTLKQAKRRLDRAHCRVGKVRYVRTGRSGRIVRQSAPGATRAAAFSVVLVVARRGG